MKLPTRLFILFQILDLSLTFFALRWGLAYELNPLSFTAGLVLLKFFAIMFISIIMERVNFPKLIWIVPGVSGAVVVWNTFIIAYEIYAKFF